MAHTIVDAAMRETEPARKSFTKNRIVNNAQSSGRGLRSGLLGLSKPKRKRHKAKRGGRR